MDRISVRKKHVVAIPVFTILAVALALFIPIKSWATTINFDNLTDSTAVTNQYSSQGATFLNATVLTSGISLNEYDFPPHSGNNVVFDDGGPITITFSSPMSQVGGYFTYSEPLTLTAYDNSGATLGSVNSAWSSNMAYPGDGDPGSSPNELLQLSFSNEISSLVVSGDPAGYSFTMDDFTFTSNSPAAPVPEPGSLALCLGLLGTWFIKRLCLCWKRAG